MEFELKNGQGSAFPNQKKTDKAPDFKGAIKTPKGETFEIAFWKKMSNKGTEFFSLSIQEPFAPTKQENKTTTHAIPGNDLPDDGLPF